MKALYFEEFGGPEMLRYGALADPVAGAGALLVRTEAIGLNFADVYRRRGNYHLEGRPPYVLGYEAAGCVEAAPAGCGFELGQRVAFMDVPHANAEKVVVPIEKAVALPDDISCELAAALLLQGLTAHYLIRDSYPARAGELALVHAAAGGVGQLLTQQLVTKGVRVLALTSTPAKAEIARQAGAERVFLYDEPWVEDVLGASGGRGADVVFDSVGKTLPASLRATRIGGAVVFYGMAGGDPAPIDPRLLMDTSKTLTGGDLWNVLTSAEERRRRSAELFELVRSGALRVSIQERFPLARGAEAHRLMESRGSTGKILLIP